MSTGQGRQANGRSSIYQDDAGQWHAYVTVGVKPDGSPDRRHRRGRTRKEVTAKVADLEKARTTGTVTVTGRAPTVAQYLEQWLDGCRLRLLKPNSIVGYDNAIRLHIVPVIGSVRLTAVSVEDVEKVFTSMVAAGRTRSTPAVRRTMSAAFGQAVKRGLMPRNPVQLANAPRVDEFQVEPLSVDEAKALLAAALNEPGGGAVWVLSLSLGMRKGEVLALLWNDVDLEAGHLTVGRSLSRQTWRHGCADEAACGVRAMKCPQRVGGGLVVSTPKSDAGARPIALPTQLVDALRVHRRWQREARLRAGSRWVDSGAVFTTAWGRPVDPRAHHDAWVALLAGAGVRPARLHDARHTAATLLLLQGVDSRVVMALMGWSQISMLKKYQHVVPTLRRAAADSMGEALWGTSGDAV